MNAAQVTTVAANPVLLLKKLCDVEGATATVTEYMDHPSSGRIYARIVADIGGGVFIEVVDWFVKMSYDREDFSTIPHVFQMSGFPWNIKRWYKQEANEEDKTRSDLWYSYQTSPGATGFGFSGTASQVTAENAPFPQSFTLPYTGAISWTHATGNIGKYGRAADTDHRGIFRPYNVRWTTTTRDDGKPAFAMLTGNLPPGVASFHYINETASHSRYTNRIRPSLTLESGASTPPRASCPLGIYCSDAMTSFATHLVTTPSWGSVVSWGGLDLSVSLVAYSAIRVACAVDDQGELVNPSPWEALPIFPKIRSDGNGYVAFYSDAVGDYGGGVICGKVDTDRGNKAAGNYAYVVRNYIPTWAVVSFVRTSIAISGGEASAGKRMNIFTPNPPIATDSVSGGPVVSDVFLYDDLEIRGIAKGVLGCNTGMTGGYMGWMEGKRYRMLTSGIMVQW